MRGRAEEEHTLALVASQPLRGDHVLKATRETREEVTDLMRAPELKVLTSIGPRHHTGGLDGQTQR